LVQQVFVSLLFEQGAFGAGGGGAWAAVTRALVVDLEG
jgi:hypothetical protein